MFPNRKSLFRTLTVASAFVGALTLATGAFAGQCPGDKMGKDVTKPATHAAKDVTDKVLASIDLAREAVKLDKHLFRLRQLVIQPGGIVPWHSHGERPALIYIVSGEVKEFASNCSVAIVHKAGEVSIETSGVAHWWKNEGNTPVVLLSADILRDHSDKNM
jgi:quercetin dioxygenase-like cupin family protein